jgi:prophage regulatory protein
MTPSNDTPNEASQQDQKLIGIREVARITNLGRSTIYARIAKGEFPRSIPISPHRRAFLLREVLSWIGSRVADRDRDIRERSLHKSKSPR